MLGSWVEGLVVGGARVVTSVFTETVAGDVSRTTLPCLS